MPESQPVSWRSIVYGTRVVTRDGEPAGKIREVLGSDAEDVFHGLRVELDGDHRDVMLSSDDVASMATDEVQTDLTNAEISALPAFDEQGSYHLASVGWLRKHLAWQKDATGDEEPG